MIRSFICCHLTFSFPKIQLPAFLLGIPKQCSFCASARSLWDCTRQDLFQKLECWRTWVGGVLQRLSFRCLWQFLLLRQKQGYSFLGEYSSPISPICLYTFLFEKQPLRCGSARGLQQGRGTQQMWQLLMKGCYCLGRGWYRLRIQQNQIYSRRQQIISVKLPILHSVKQNHRIFMGRVCSYLGRRTISTSIVMHGGV